jgi:hypothetical protein
MAPKKTEKTEKKLPKIPGLPKDANIKVIEISPRMFIIPLLLIAIVWAIFESWSSYNSEKVVYHDDI